MAREDFSAKSGLLSESGWLWLTSSVFLKMGKIQDGHLKKKINKKSDKQNQVICHFWLIDRQTDRQTDSFIPPIYNTIWWGRLLLRHKHMLLSKEPPYNNDKQWITLYIKYTYRPVMWVRRLLNVTYWKGRSGEWLCYSLKTVQTVDEKWMMYRWWDEAEYIL